MERNFIDEWKKRCLRHRFEEKGLLSPSPQSKLMVSNFGEYEIVKIVNEQEKPIAFGLTLDEAERLVRLLKPRLDRLRDDENIFGFEIFKITVNGRERLSVYHHPRFEPSFEWVG